MNDVPLIAVAIASAHQWGNRMPRSLSMGGEGDGGEVRQITSKLVAYAHGLETRHWKLRCPASQPAKLFASCTLRTPTKQIPREEEAEKTRLSCVAGQVIRSLSQ